VYSEAGFDFGVCVVPGFGLIRLAVPRVVNERDFKPTQQQLLMLSIQVALITLLFDATKTSGRSAYPAVHRVILTCQTLC